MRTEVPTIDEATRARFRWGQREAFVLAWLLYVALYLVRRNLDGTKPALLSGDAGLTKEGLAAIDSAYLVAYAGGSFVAGILGDWFGAKRVISVALAVAVAANVAFGLSDGVAAMAVAQAVNGLAQACGFPLCVKIVASWFPPSRRASASSLFLTSYTVGDFAAKALAADMVDAPGWRYAFYVPSAIVAVFLVIVLWGLRAAPRDAGLPDVSVVSGEAEAAKPAEGAKKAAFGAELRELLAMPAVWTILSSYVLLKLVRYVFVGWSNVFVFETLHYSPADATRVTLWMTVGGVVGTVATGWATDRLFGGRRAPAVIIEILLLAVATVFFARLTPGDEVLTVVLMFVVGFLVYGADAVLSAASAMDLGAEKGAASAAGLINGAGNVGTIASASVGGFLSNSLGWEYAWYGLAGLLVVSGLLLAPRWNVKGRG